MTRFRVKTGPVFRPITTVPGPATAIAEVVLAARKRLNITVVQASVRTGVNETSISLLESDGYVRHYGSIPSKRTLIRLGLGLDCLEELLLAGGYTPRLDPMELLHPKLGDAIGLALEAGIGQAELGAWLREAGRKVVAS